MNDKKQAQSIVSKISAGKLDDAFSDLDTFILADSTIPNVQLRAKMATEAGVFPAVLKVLQSKGSSLQNSNLSNSLRNMCLEDGVRSQFAKSGIPEVFVKSLKGKESDLGYVDFVGTCLGNLLYNAEDAQRLMDAGMIELFDNAIQFADTIDVYLDLALHLSSLCSHDFAAERAKKTQLMVSVKFFISQCRSDRDAEIKAWSVVQNLSTPAESTKYLISIGIFDEIFRSLKSSDIDVRFAACAVAGNLTREEAAQKAIISSGNLPAFIKLVQEYQSASDPSNSRINALCVVRNCSVIGAGAAIVMKSFNIFHKEWQAAMKEPGESNVNLRFTYSLIYNLSTNESELTELRKRNIVDDIMPLLKNEEIFFRTAAKMTLANLVGHIEKHPLLEADPQLLGELCTILQCRLVFSLCISSLCLSVSVHISFSPSLLFKACLILPVWTTRCMPSSSGCSGLQFNVLPTFL
jgi:hypothetical protein